MNELDRIELHAVGRTVRVGIPELNRAALAEGLPASPYRNIVQAGCRERHPRERRRAPV